MACSFTPSGKWFCFDTDTGDTLAKGFASKRSAEAWITRQLAEIAKASAAASH